MSRVRSKVWSLVLVLGLLACGDDAPEGPVLKVPGAPRSVSAVPGDGQATVSWSAPLEDGGSAILRYSVQALRDGAVAKTQEGSATSLTVTGLTNGASYTFVVTAGNAQGAGPASAASAPVVPRVTPGAPRDVTATPGNQQVTVSWSEPTDTGMPIVGYTVTVRQGETVVTTQQASGLSATISGLTNGTSYLVSVSASNSVLAGPESSPVAVMPVTTPGAPDGSLVVYVDRVAFSWTVPADGGSPITGYTVTLKQGAQVVRTEETSETTFTFSGLTYGTEYTFIVAANSAVGRGPESEPEVVMPCGYSSPPMGLRSEPGNGQVQLFWRAPADTGGCPVSRYRIGTLLPGGEYVTWTTTELSYTVTGLQNGTSYKFSVYAQTTWLENEAASVNQTPRTVPAAPSNLAAAPANGSVRLTWTPPNDGGAALNGYVLTVTPGDQPPIDVDGTANEVLVSDLTNGTSYTFTLIARNVAGTGPSATVQATPATP
ncbi:fibronectin type III domain-containing protein [Pyxidicoccus caerfyrddinensis]|uniref:fibronectin type III domain-containing protein n=1 Tax=Pyxidicoccus caerfyrddinensis TaxID=2709663 RepID=UPI0013DB2853|nr:fibronectin type III domain-containing protein [Pyxidicoccus caerfyrddinensis]